MTRICFGCATPWGRADDVTKTSHPDILRVTTPSHGGYKVKGKALTEMRRKYPMAAAQGENGWFEEDCAWSLVALAFPVDFAAVRDAALRTAKHDYPHIVQQEFGIPVKLEESRRLQEEDFMRRAESLYVTDAAFGDWCQGESNYTDYVDVPTGMVGAVCCRVTEGKRSKDKLAFLIPVGVYRSDREEYGFLINPDQLPPGVTVWQTRR